MDKHEFLREAKERLNSAVKYWSENYEMAEKDISFLLGNQWDKEAVVERRREGRPILTLNKLPQYIKRLIGEQRQLSNSIVVRPTNGNVLNIKIKNLAGTRDYSLAQVYEGIIKNIEYISKAQEHYKRAFTHAVQRGIGWLRVLTYYSNDTAFDLDIKIESIKNTWSVYTDPNASEPDLSDMDWCFIITRMTKKQFKKAYPNVSLEGLESNYGNISSLFSDSEHVGVAEYFVREPIQRTLLLMSNGETYWQDEAEPILDELAEAGVTIVKSRKVQTHKVMWYKLIAHEILEKQEWVGTTIPVVPVFGEEVDYKDKLILKSLIRDAVDAQKMHNYWMTAATEKVALAPKAPFIANAQAIEGYEDMWKTANVKNWSVLLYNGNIPPTRANTVNMPAAELQLALTMVDEIKSSIGMYDASLGARSNETSGRAIVARAQQSELGAFVFFDNLNKAIHRIGQILVEIIPKVYDTNRIVRLTFPDGSGDFVEINKTIIDQQTGKPVVVHDLGQAKFDVYVSSGASYQTKRMEAAANMIDFVKAIPQTAQIAPDLIAMNMDFPQAPEIAERLRKTLPPNLLTPEEQEELQQNMVQPQPTEMDLKQMELQRMQIEAQMAQAEAQRLQALAQIEQLNLKGANIQEQVKQLVADALADLLTQQENTQKVDNNTE